MANVELAPPSRAVAGLELREIVQWSVNIGITANVTQIVLGSVNTAVGVNPKRRMRLISVAAIGNCSAAANTPELNIGVFKNLIPTGLPTPNTTNRAMVAKKVAVVNTGVQMYSNEPLDAGMDEFNGTTDIWSVGAWATGATGTLTASACHVRLEFLIL